MTDPAGSPARRSQLATVLRVTGGNFLEMYDFFVFGYYAAAIGRVFFPSESEFASLMFSLATFGAAFLMRPLGAIVLGAYIDRHGRRAGLLLTLALMAIGTLSIAIAPGYGSIGLIAPVIVVLGRLVQGFSAGAELGGVSVYLAEMATPGNKGFYVAWQSASQQVAVIFAAALGLALQKSLSPAEMDSFGWRIPLLIGCLIIPFLFVIRRSLQETEAFQHRKAPASLTEIWRTMLANWRIVLIGMMLVTMTTVSFYLITVYTPTFGRQALHLDATDVLIVTVCVGVSNLFWLPVMGALSDRGRAASAPAPVHGARAAHRLSGDLLARLGAQFRAAPRHRAVAVLPLRELQRRHGGAPHGDHAAGGPQRRLLPGLQPRHRDLRRLHPVDLHLAD